MATSHNFVAESLPEIRVLPSGQNAAQTTEPPCGKVMDSWTVVMVDTWTAPSVPPETNVLPSGEKATQLTGPRCTW